MGRDISIAISAKDNFTQAIPEPLHIDGKRAELFINPQTGELFYEYADIPLTDAERLLKEHIDSLNTAMAHVLGVE